MSEIEERERASRVLVVDDSPHIREMLEHLLSRAGYDVTTADSAPAALKTALGGRFDLIISDIGMPGTSGYNLARDLRSSAEYRGVPMLAMTGYPEFGDRHTAVWSGFDEHLRKPIEPTELLGVIGRMLGRRRPPRGL